MVELNLKVQGMMCNGCENRVQNVIKSIDGVEEVKADHKTGNVQIKLNKQIDKSILIEQIEDIGYEVK